MPVSQCHLRDLAVQNMDGPFSLFRHVVVVGDQDNGVALGVKLMENVNDLLAGFGVQCAGGFVCQNQLGIGDDGPGDGHTLLLTAGKLCGHVLCPGQKAYPIQGGFHPLLALRSGNTLVNQRQFHVFFRGELGDQVELLDQK